MKGGIRPGMYNTTLGVMGGCGELVHWLLLRTTSHKVITVMEVSIGVPSTEVELVSGCGGVNLLSKVVVVIGTRVGDVGTAGDERSLRLGSLGLLTALVSSLLLLHLLVSEGSQATGNLLDLVAGHLLCEGLGKVLKEQAVLGALGMGRDEGSDGVAQGLELSLGLGVEEGQLGDVDGVGRVLGVDGDGGMLGLGFGSASADADVAKHVGGVGEVGLLLRTSETLAALGFSLFKVIVGVLGVLRGLTSGLTLGDALTLGLLCCSGGSSSSSLGLGGLLLLLTLYLGVLSVIPIFEDLKGVSALVSHGLDGRARGLSR